MKSRDPHHHGSGGGLRICGLLWLVADDDFVFTALFEFVVRVVGLCGLVGLLIYTETEEHTCIANYNLKLYLIGSVAVMALAIANDVVLGLSSAQGPGQCSAYLLKKGKQ